MQAALQEHKQQLVEDAVVHSHLAALYDTLLEQNLVRLVEPFSRVEVAHLAQLIKLPLQTVLDKLSQVCTWRRWLAVDSGCGHPAQLFDRARWRCCLGGQAPVGCFVEGQGCCAWAVDVRACTLLRADDVQWC